MQDQTYTDKDRELDILYRRICILKDVIDSRKVVATKQGLGKSKRDTRLEKSFRGGLEHLHDSLAVRYVLQRKSQCHNCGLPKTLNLCKPCTGLVPPIELFSWALITGKIEFDLERGVFVKVSGAELFDSDAFIGRIRFLEEIIQSEKVVINRLEIREIKRCTGLEKNLMLGLKYIHDFLLVKYTRLRRDHADADSFLKGVTHYGIKERLDPAIDLFAKMLFGGKIELNPEGYVVMEIVGPIHFGF